MQKDGGFPNVSLTLLIEHSVYYCIFLVFKKNDFKALTVFFSNDIYNFSTEKLKYIRTNY